MRSPLHRLSSRGTRLRLCFHCLLSITASSIGVAVLQYLLQESATGQRQIERSYHPTDRARGQEVIATLERPGFPIKPREGERYRNPIVVLTGPATYSAAEDFLIAWKSSGRGKIIGEPSGGSTGQSLGITLPGGGSARICSKKDTFADGGVWEGIGIQPDIPVHQTVGDLAAGRDTVVERAVEYLKGLKSGQ
jgi:C-terminal processing protease CtpA/Prc